MAYTLVRWLAWTLLTGARTLVVWLRDLHARLLERRRFIMTELLALADPAGRRRRR